MNVYILCAGNESFFSARFPFRIGRFSYIAKGNIILAEKNIPEDCGDMMVVSMKDADEYITPAIYDECRKREYTSVFLDADEPPGEKSIEVFSKVSASLDRRGISTFCPLSFSSFCPHSVPVADGAVTGGILKEEFSRLIKGKRRIGISLPRILSRFEMPARDAAGSVMTPRELSRLISTFDARIFFSPQLITNYFLYSPAREECTFVLCDTADTLSKKLRLAKELGFSDAFLMYREISDIAKAISF